MFCFQLLGSYMQIGGYSLFKNKFLFLYIGLNGFGHSWFVVWVNLTRLQEMIMFLQKAAYENVTSISLSKSSPQDCLNMSQSVQSFLQAEHRFFCPVFYVFCLCFLSLKLFYIWAVVAHSYDSQGLVGVVGVIYKRLLLTHNKDLMSYPAWLDRRHKSF